MNENYYEILGIPVGAEKKDIKRAYFKLVRTYSPEKNPEKFQEIRNAYENLMSDNITSGQVPTSIPDVPLAKSMMRQIEARMKTHDYAGVAATAEEAIHLFGELETFQYYQGIANRYAGNTGNAVKNFEKLTKSYPNKVLYFRELAISNMDRGFGKKALAAFEQAYEMGSRDDEFLRLFSLCCNERKKYKRGTEVLLVLIKKENRNLRDSMEDMLEAFTGLFIMNISAKETKLMEILFDFYSFIESADVYLQEYQELVTEVIASMLLASLEKGVKVQSEVEKVMNRLKTRLQEDHINNLVEMVKMNALSTRINQDERLSELIKMGYEAFMDPPEMYKDDQQILRFMRLDMELCILEAWDSIQEEIEIIKREYPDYYGAVSEFVERLEHGGNRNLLRERLQKDYDRLEQYIDGGTYYEKYPERQRHSGEVKWDSYEEGTFMRQERKVGRNDPCPCGSGKKYKNCCGRN